jgi:hypothetical protein
MPRPNSITRSAARHRAIAAHADTPDAPTRLTRPHTTRFNAQAPNIRAPWHPRLAPKRQMHHASTRLHATRFNAKRPTFEHPAAHASHRSARCTRASTRPHATRFNAKRPSFERPDTHACAPKRLPSEARSHRAPHIRAPWPRVFAPKRKRLRSEARLPPERLRSERLASQAPSQTKRARRSRSRTSHRRAEPARNAYARGLSEALSMPDVSGLTPRSR